MRNRTGILALLALIFGAMPVWADDPAPLLAMVAGKTISLAIPDKTCLYDKKQKVDARLLEAMEKSDPRSQLLAAFMDCDNLRAVRGEKGAVPVPGYYGQILSNIAGQAAADNYVRETYVQGIAAAYGNVPPEKNMEQGEELLRNFLAGTVDFGPVKVLGLIRKDKDFIQIGMLGTSPTPTGAVQKIINVITLTKLGVPVTIYLAHPAGGDMTLKGLSDRAELYTRQLLELNPEGSGLFAKGFSLPNLVLGAIVGFLLGITIGFIFFRSH